MNDTLTSWYLPSTLVLEVLHGLEPGDSKKLNLFKNARFEKVFYRLTNSQMVKIKILLIRSK
jgi:hypothetical protein